MALSSETILMCSLRSRAEATALEVGFFRKEPEAPSHSFERHQINHLLTSSRLQDLCCAILILGFHLGNVHSSFKTQLKSFPNTSGEIRCLLHAFTSQNYLCLGRYLAVSHALLCPRQTRLLESRGGGMAINMFLDLSWAQHQGEPKSKGETGSSLLPSLAYTWPCCKNIYRPLPRLGPRPLLYQLTAMSPDRKSHLPS